MTSTVAPRPAQCFRLDSSPAPARQARRAVRENVEARGLCCSDPAIGECTDTLLLIVSELVTNATRHSHGPQEMRIAWDGPEITLEVDDDTPAVPCVRPASERGETGGFGMDLIDQLARAWGTRPRPGGRTGKTVYVCFVFPAPAV
ncbi:ATP-binding protein [Streptomyces sp. NPDC096030]|uniref:ATP-binding protein n=1 Tax=Streptomyces sp. NPDC096030 TaxID=3155423 RepID=UPI00333121DF